MDDDRIVQIVAAAQRDFIKWRLDAMTEWQQQHSESVRMGYVKTRVMWMYESAFANAEIAGYRILEYRNQKCILLEDGKDAVAVSMKQLIPGTLRTSNYPTDTREQIRETGYVNFEGMVLIHVTCGHIIETNAVGLDEVLARMFLTREREGDVKMTVPMYTAKRGIIPMIPGTLPSLFVPPILPVETPPAPEALPRFRIKPRAPAAQTGMPKVGIDAKKKDVARSNVSKNIGRQGA